MKNIIMVDLDTDREQQVKITKPEGMVENLNDTKSAKDMVIADISTLCNGLGTLIQVGGENGYFKAEDLASLCVKYLNDNFLNEK